MPTPSQSLSPAKTPRLPIRWRGLTFGLFAFCLILSAANLFIPPWPGSGWLDAALLFLTTTATIAALAERLPPSNILLAAAVAAAIGGMTHAVNSATGLPFGRFEFQAALGPRLLDILPFAVPAFWAIAALTARGAARLLLHESRAHSRHGFQVIGLATVLMVLFSLGLEPFATTAKGWWTSNPTPVLNAASWAMAGLLIQIAVTPLLLDKFPGPRPPNVGPLLVWVGINGLLTLGLLRHGLWLEGIIPSAATVGVLVLGLRNLANTGSTAHA